MVTVLVGNHQSIDVADVTAMGSEPLFRLPTTDPGVKQKTNPIRLDVDAVSITARLKRHHSHGGIVVG